MTSMTSVEVESSTHGHVILHQVPDEGVSLLADIIESEVSASCHAGLLPFSRHASVVNDSCNDKLYSDRHALEVNDSCNDKLYSDRHKSVVNDSCNDKL